MPDVAGEVHNLKTRTIAAHRAYIDTLIAWELLVEAGEMEAGVDHEQACADAEARKEEHRVVFRDLVDELGYVPNLSGPSTI